MFSAFLEPPIIKASSIVSGSFVFRVSGNVNDKMLATVAIMANDIIGS